jgi:hypothetical protein
MTLAVDVSYQYFMRYTLLSYRNHKTIRDRAITVEQVKERGEENL